jgi:hypothetical protein
MKIPVLWLKVCLFAFVAISVVLTFQLTVAAQQICNSGVRDHVAAGHSFADLSSHAD